MSEVFNNNEFTSEPSQQSSNSYPYSFEQPFDAQQQPFAAQPQPSAPVPEQKKKSGKAGKIVALLLACALVGGGSGFGAAALMQKNAAAQPQSTTQASSDASVCSRPSGRQRLCRSHPLTPARYSRRARSMRRT